MNYVLQSQDSNQTIKHRKKRRNNMSNKPNMCVWQRIEFTEMNMKKRKETEIHEIESRKKLNSSISPAFKRKNLNKFID